MGLTFRRIGTVGLAVIGVSLLLMQINPKTAGAMPEGFSTPVLAFEFVRTLAEVDALFAVEEQAALADAFDRGSYVDFGYMLLYAGFLLLLALHLARQTGQPLLWLAAALAVLIFLGDALENVQLLALTEGVRNGRAYEPALSRLYFFTWLKWGGLAIYFLLLTPALFAGGWLARLTGIAAIATFALGGVAFLYRSVFNEIFALAVAGMFVLLITLAFLADVTIRTQPSFRL